MTCPFMFCREEHLAHANNVACLRPKQGLSTSLEKDTPHVVSLWFQDIKDDVLLVDKNALSHVIKDSFGMKTDNQQTKHF